MYQPKQELLDKYADVLVKFSSFLTREYEIL